MFCVSAVCILPDVHFFITGFVGHIVGYVLFKKTPPNPTKNLLGKDDA